MKQDKKYTEVSESIKFLYSEGSICSPQQMTKTIKISCKPDCQGCVTIIEKHVEITGVEL